jgi:hypothetical protein
MPPKKKNNVFEAIFSDVTVFKKIFKHFDKELIIETNIVLYPNGIHILAMNSAHTILIDFIMRDVAFESYHCESIQILGIKFESLLKILGCGSKGQKMTISYSGENCLSFFFDDNSKQHF